MARTVTKNYPRLFNGVSQQPPQVRLDSQCEEQINFMSDPVDGLSKRPGSWLLGRCTAGPAASEFGDSVLLHGIPEKTVNGTTYGPYMVVVSKEDTKAVRIYDLQDGSEESYSESNNTLRYLEDSIWNATGDPQIDVRAITVGDTTFFVNTSVHPRMEDAEPASSLALDELTDSGLYKWTISSGNIGTYRLELAAGGDPGLLEPSQLFLDESADDPWRAPKSIIDKAASAAAVSFNTNDWGWGDEDLLGYNTVYIDADIIDGLSSTALLKAAKDEPWIYIWVKAGWTSTPCEFTLDGTALTALSSADTATVAENIAQAILTQSAADATYDYLVEKLGAGATGGADSSVIRVLRVVQSTNTPVTSSLSFGTGGGSTAVAAINGRVASFTDLPPIGKDGDVVLIEGDEGVTVNGRYYVKWQDSTGTWTECPAPLQPVEFEGYRMPIRLTHSEGVFEFSSIPWANREAGDDDTNPPPSFIDNPIKDVFYIQNRLGFITNDSVILSRSDDPFNFWGATATDVLDDDPIDTSVTDSQSGNLLWAVPHQKSVLLFGDQTQYTLGTGEGRPWTPSTVVVDPSTRLNCSNRCRPIMVGSNAYFVSSLGNLNRIREYFVTEGAILSEAQDATKHVSNYIRGEMSQLIPIDDADTFLVATWSGEANPVSHLYAYRYLWQGDEKVLSSWSKWNFDNIGNTSWKYYGGLNFGDSRVYSLVGDPTNNEYTIEYMDLTDDSGTDTDGSINYGVFPRLDSMQPVRDTSPEAYAESSYTEAVFFLDDGTYYQYFLYQYVYGTEGQAVEWYLIRENDWTPYQAILEQSGLGNSYSILKFLKSDMDPNGTFGTGRSYIGRKFESSYKLSEVYLKDRDGSILLGDLRLLQMVQAFERLSDYSMEVTSVSRGTTETRNITTVTTPSTNTETFDVLTPKGERKVYLYGDARDLEITLKSDSPYPLTINNLSILCDYTNKSRVR